MVRVGLTMRIRSLARAFRLDLTSATVLALAIVLTSIGFALTREYQERQEQRILGERARDFTTIFESFTTQIEATLEAGAVVAEAADGNVVTFRRFMSERVDRSLLSSLVVLRLDEGAPTVVTQVGRSEPALLPTFSAAEHETLLAIAERGGLHEVSVGKADGMQTVGFGTAAGSGSEYIAYAEVALPEIWSNPGAAPPDGIEFAFYVGDVEDSSKLLATNAVELPVAGKTVRTMLEVGAERTTLVVGSDGVAVGGLTRVAPLLVLVLGFGGAIMITAFLEIRHRRDEAEHRATALAEQNERLRELDRMKDEFVSLVSHELRTPLTSIRGYLELLREENGALSEEQSRFLDVVDRNADRLLRLVGDLLFVAQLEAGNMNLNDDQLNLDEVAHGCIEAAIPQAQGNGIEIRLESSDSPQIRGDGARIAQLIDNLVVNAIKFTPEGGEVTVRVGHDADKAILEVADTGIGISDEEKKQLFDRFYRAREASAHQIQGTGLGLTIAKAIAEAHGGEISITSTVGVGTTFQIVLPLAGTQASTDAPVTV